MVAKAMSQPAAPGAQSWKPKGGVEAVKLRNEFYRDKFRTTSTSLAIVCAALLVSLSLNYFQATRKPMERYFAVDGAGRIIPIRALTEPYVTDGYLANWVGEKVARAYSMDPHNFQRQVADLQPFFTPEGYEQYVQSLKSSGTIDFMTKNLLVSSGVASGAAIVVDRGIRDGVYYWKVELPMVVDFRSATKAAQKRRIVQLTVVRRLTIESPDGIGISQFVASDI